nr:immunoglobulin light chain junction region [Mus musculus]
CQQFTSSPSTF